MEDARGLDDFVFVKTNYKNTFSPNMSASY